MSFSATRINTLVSLLVFPAVALSLQLTPDIQADRYLVRAQRQIEEQNFSGAKQSMDRILDLKAQFDLQLPAEFFFRYAEVLDRLELHDDVIEAATKYLTLVGRDDEHYRQVLELLDRAEQAKAAAETFHNLDGVVFEGTIRRVVSGAAVCNVLQEKYSEQEYERLKGNQGRPLDLWQVDFAVRNESGREIEYLRASGWVHSEHPPCTNWSGEGPGGGPIRPESGLMIPTDWADYYEVLPMSNGMRRDQQERRARYLLVFEGQQPRFGEWNIDYRFAAGESSSTTQRGRGPRVPSAAASFELPPEIEADRYLRQAEQAVRDGNAEIARTAMERLEALQQEHGLEPKPEDHYRYAEAWEAAGERQRAMAAAARYLRLQGREAEHYTAALDLMNRAELGQTVPAAGPAKGATPTHAPEPSCAGQVKGTSCWMELSNQPGCYAWNHNLQVNETVSWSAGCAEGMATGSGTLKWVSDGGKETSESTGRLQSGQYNGHWVLRSADGSMEEGPFVDGKRHGQWVERHADGGGAEGPWVDGKPHGHWVIRLPDGQVQEGPYVDGKKQGRWDVRLANGDVHEGPYVDGKPHGQWVERYADGGGAEGPWVDGKRHGQWVVRSPNGSTRTATCRNGECQ